MSRHLHLIDIENVLLNPRPTEAQVAALRVAYAPLVGPADLVVIACNHGAFAAVGWGWPGVRYLIRSGENGADSALLEVLDHEDVKARFDDIVVANGDGIFTDAVAGLGGEGVCVTVVARAEALANRLRMASSHIVWVSDICAAAEFGESA